ncbi:MAG: ABC transporter permease [Bacteroidetes bacterium]|nr:ABC transporter permease [Bacteroidota bacterium]
MGEMNNRNKWNHWSLKVIVFYVFISLLAPVISNDLPLLRIYQGEWSFPFLNQEQEYNFSEKTIDGGFEIHAPFGYSSGKSDPLNMSFRGPFDHQLAQNKKGELVEIPLMKRHWLGTNLLGSDLLADILYGTRVSLFISVIATLLASVLALFLGFLAGWFGPTSLKISAVKMLLIFLLFIFWVHLLLNVESSAEGWLGWGVSLFVFIFMMKILAKRKMDVIANVKIFIPIDAIFLRISELFSAIPRVILVLAFIQLLSASLLSIILLLALSAWVDLARIVRAELQSIKSMTYVDAAVMSGIHGARLLLIQILPNIWPTVLVFMLYTFAGNIAIEAGLSFLGFGVPATVKTLGGLISEGKNNFEAWWMIVFPGLWLSVLIYSMFCLSDRLRKTEN